MSGASSAPSTSCTAASHPRPLGSASYGLRRRSAPRVALRLSPPPVIPVRPQPLAALARPLGLAAKAPGRRPATGLWTTGITEPTDLTPPARIGHDRRLRLRRDPPQVVLTRETGWSYTGEIRWSSSEEIGRSSIRKFCTKSPRSSTRSVIATGRASPSPPNECVTPV